MKSGIACVAPQHTGPRPADRSCKKPLLRTPLTAAIASDARWTGRSVARLPTVPAVGSGSTHHRDTLDGDPHRARRAAERAGVHGQSRLLRRGRWRWRVLRGRWRRRVLRGLRSRRGRPRCSTQSVALSTHRFPPGRVAARELEGRSTGRGRREFRRTFGCARRLRSRNRTRNRRGRGGLGCGRARRRSDRISCARLVRVRVPCLVLAEHRPECYESHEDNRNDPRPLSVFLPFTSGRITPLSGGAGALRRGFSTSRPDSVCPLIAIPETVD